MKKIGCVACWSAGLGRAYDLVKSLPVRVNLMDETDFIVNILACPHCSQSFLEITEDIVNWQCGDDALFRKFMPITSEESAQLINANSYDLDIIRVIGKDKQTLKYDHIVGLEPELCWNAGLGAVHYKYTGFDVLV